MISVEYISKKGKEMCHSIMIIGRKLNNQFYKNKKKISIKSKNEAVSRKGDSLSTGHICTGTTTLNTDGQGTCFANSILIARVSATVSHPFPPHHLVQTM